MTRDEANRHLIAARRVIVGWEAMGVPIGRPEDTLRIIGQEIEILRQIIAEHPGKSITVGELVKRYEAVAARVRARSH